MQTAVFRVRVFPRTLRFINPAGTSRGVLTERPVWYIVVQRPGAPQYIGIGECAPLPGLSPEYNRSYYTSRMRKACDRLEQTGEIDYTVLRRYPSILFGLETALASLAAAERGEPGRLYPSAFSRGERPLCTNGLIWMGTYDEMHRRADEKFAQGFSTIKVKIGAINHPDEMRLLRYIRSCTAVDPVSLRVDANGAYAPHQARHMLEYLSAFNIHSIEQPIKRGQWKEMAALCADTPVPIALDEELIGVYDRDDKERLLDTIRPQYLVLKPSLHGGVRGTLEWMELCRARYIRYWVTSALESNIGLNAIADFTACYADEAFTRAQGLGTGQLFVENDSRSALSLEGEKLWKRPAYERNFQKEIAQLASDFASEKPTLFVKTSGSTGIPKTIEVEKARMRASARRTLLALNIPAGVDALLCLPVHYIAGRMQWLRAALAPLRLIEVAPTSRPYATLRRPPYFAALTPQQVYETLCHPRERRLLRATPVILIGGGALGGALTTALRKFPGRVVLSYGMTETLSNIALSDITAGDAPDTFRPYAGVELNVTPDGQLRVYDPVTTAEPLMTNDLVTLLPDGRFRLTGRADCVVNSGGIKLQIEELEALLEDAPAKCHLTYVDDERLGQALTLAYKRLMYLPAEPALEAAVKRYCREHLPKYAQPKYYFGMPELPCTRTGKPARAALHVWAETLVLKDF